MLRHCPCCHLHPSEAKHSFDNIIVLSLHGLMFVDMNPRKGQADAEESEYYVLGGCNVSLFYLTYLFDITTCRLMTLFSCQFSCYTILNGRNINLVDKVGVNKQWYYVSKSKAVRKCGHSSSSALLCLCELLQALSILYSLGLRYPFITLPQIFYHFSFTWGSYSYCSCCFERG